MAEKNNIIAITALKEGLLYALLIQGDTSRNQEAVLLITLFKKT